jgi:DNA-binding IclR family transcriptional regulator
MTRSLEPKKIKSAVRALEVLEYFNSKRVEATVMEISRALGYPQSSTSELLNCLVEEGFIHRNRYLRTYRPMARVVALGAWVQPKLFRNGGLLPLMDEISHSTGCSVSLGTVVGVKVQQLHEIIQTNSEPEAFSTGSLAHSAVGKALLSSFDFTTIRKLIHRLNAAADGQYPYVRPDELLVEVELIRRRGYALAGNTAAVRLPHNMPDEPLALGIYPSADAEHGAEYWADVLLNAVGEHFGAPTSAARPTQGPVPAWAEPIRRPDLSRDRTPCDVTQRLAENGPVKQIRQTA